MTLFNNVAKEVIVKFNDNVIFHYAGNPSEEEFQSLLDEEMAVYSPELFKIYSFGIEITNQYIN